ncbi:MAG: ribonuclease P protein component 1 [Candidatus Nanohaloarchaea archaeon]|nr:ribonuclease P protein component 1 [Candidatus Nanohaloarchaea archaeon]
MPRNPENLVRHELIGLPVDVVSAADPGMEGASGQVVDETRQTLVVAQDGDEVQVPKEGARFRFELEDAEVAVDGDILVARPEERILKKFPRKWEYAD